MRAKTGKQNTALPSGRGPQLGPAVEKQGPFFWLKITGAQREGDGRGPPDTPAQTLSRAHPGITLLPEAPQTMQRPHGAGIPVGAASEQGRLQVASRPSPGWGLGPRLGTGVPGCPRAECCATLGKSPTLSGPPSPPLEKWGLSRCPLKSKGNSASDASRAGRKSAASGRSASAVPSLKCVSGTAGGGAEVGRAQVRLVAPARAMLTSRSGWARTRSPAV